jgi:hypothetical protein
MDWKVSYFNHFGYVRNFYRGRNHMGKYHSRISKRSSFGKPGYSRGSNCHPGWQN